MFRQPTLILLISLCAATAGRGAEVDFDRDVRPILSDKCFHCHGPDPETREAGLRLDIREAAIAPRKRGAAVVPDSSLDFPELPARAVRRSRGSPAADGPSLNQSCRPADEKEIP